MWFEMAFDYQAWLTAAEDRLKELKAQRSELDAEIVTLENGLRALAPLVGGNIFSKGVTGAGITETIRKIFTEAPSSAFAATGIRDDLLARGMILSQENPLAVIHQILARLREKGFVEPVEHQGKTYYRLHPQVEEPIGPYTLGRNRGGVNPPPIRPETLLRIEEEKRKKK